MSKEERYTGVFFKSGDRFVDPNGKTVNPGTPVAQDFPGRKELAAAGLQFVEDISELEDARLKELVGDKVSAVKKALKPAEPAKTPGEPGNPPAGQ